MFCCLTFGVGAIAHIYNTLGRSLSGPDKAKGSLLLVGLAVILTAMTGLKGSLMEICIP